MRKIYMFLLSVFFLLWGMGTAMADEITADTLIYDGKMQVVTAKGAVVIHDDEGATITGSKAEYHLDTRTARIIGDVRYEKNGMHATAGELFLSSDETLHATGNVILEDTTGGHLLKGDEVTFEPQTGWGSITGHAYYQSSEGVLAAPRVEGNVNEIHIEAWGGVTFSSPTKGADGRANRIIYTRSGKEGRDGKWVLSGNAHVNRNGNLLDGPELVLWDEEKIVETEGRSTLVIQRKQ